MKPFIPGFSVGNFLITDMISLVVIIGSTFLFFLNSVLEDCIFLEMYLFHTSNRPGVAQQNAQCTPSLSRWKSLGWYVSQVKQGLRESPGLGKWCFHISNDSHLVLVLSLWPLTKISDYADASCCLSLALQLLRFVLEHLEPWKGWLPITETVSRSACAKACWLLLKKPFAESMG